MSSRIRSWPVRPAFPPHVVVAIKALACELPHEHGLPLSRLSVPEIRPEAVQRGLVASISETTVWRWLAEDALRPWHHRSWLFPRDRSNLPRSFPWAHTVFSNLKTWIRGTFHGVSPKHLERYLEEFNYRFDRRWKETELFHFVLRRAVRGEPLPYARVTAEVIG